MRTVICPNCHQPARAPRLGVWLPARKTQIVDLIAAAGDIGITVEELRRDLYGDLARSPTTVRMHILQINELLIETDWRIAPIGRGANARWHLTKRGRRHARAA